MQPISFKRHRYPADVIRHAVWLYFRFTLSLRDVEDLKLASGLRLSRLAKLGRVASSSLSRCEAND